MKTTKQKRAYFKAYRAAHKDEAHAHYIANRAVILARARAWHRANRDEANKRCLARYYRNKAKRKAAPIDQIQHEEAMEGIQ